MRRSVASRMSYRNRLTVGDESAAAHSFVGASKTTSTPSNPCRPSSRLSSARTLSSRSASMVFSGTLVTIAIALDHHVSRAVSRPEQRPPHRRATEGATLLALLTPVAGPNQLMEAVEIGFERQPTELPVLEGDPADQVAHRDASSVLRREERCGEGDVTDRAAGQLELPGEEGNVDVRVERRRVGQEQLPDPLAVVGLREGEVDHEVEPPEERLVEVLPEVGREDHRAGIGLHLLQQVGDLDVRVAVVGVPYLRALAEESVRLVEEQDRVGAVGRVEDPVEVLLGLPDVLGDDRCEVDPEQLQPEVAGEHLAR